MYSKYGNCRGNLNFANRVKRHFYDFKNSRLGHGLPISVNDKLDSTIHKSYKHFEMNVIGLICC